MKIAAPIATANCRGPGRAIEMGTTGRANPVRREGANRKVGEALLTL
jgi:hypothetical protein